MIRGADFASLVHNVLVMDERYSVRDVAEKIGMPYDTFYSRVSNRVPFSAEEIRTLMVHVPDNRLPAWLLEGTAFIPASRTSTTAGADTPEESLRHTSIMMLVEASEVAHQIEKAIADKRIDHREALLIKQDIEAAERAIATVREHVRQLTS